MHAISQGDERSAFLGVAPQFTVPDVVAAASYYCEVLGFENRGWLLELVHRLNPRSTFLRGIRTRIFAVIGIIFRGCPQC